MIRKQSAWIPSILGASSTAPSSQQLLAAATSSGNKSPSPITTAFGVLVYAGENGSKMHFWGEQYTQCLIKSFVEQAPFHLPERCLGEKRMINLIDHATILLFSIT